MSDGMNSAGTEKRDYYGRTAQEHDSYLRANGVSVDSGLVETRPVVYEIGSLKFWALGDRVIIREDEFKTGYECSPTSAFRFYVNFRRPFRGPHRFAVGAGSICFSNTEADSANTK